MIGLRFVNVTGLGSFSDKKTLPSGLNSPERVSPRELLDIYVLRGDSEIGLKLVRYQNGKPVIFIGKPEKRNTGDLLGDGVVYKPGMVLKGIIPRDRVEGICPYNEENAKTKRVSIYALCRE